VKRALILTALALATLSVLSTGCAVSRLTAPVDDYRAYRATRTREHQEDRLSAAVRYLERYPRGVFAAEVRASLELQEPSFFLAKRGSVAGLVAYLSALPSGAHAAEANKELRALRDTAEHRDAMGLQAAAVEARFERAAAAREHVRKTVLRWLAFATNPRLYEAPLAEAPAELIVAWRLSLPQPACAASDDGGRRCVKLIELPYALPIDGSLEPRELTLEVRVDEDASRRPRRVTLSGPGLFNRLEEVRRVAAVGDDATSARIAAVTQVVALTRDVVERHGVAPACLAPAEAPVVLQGDCAALHVEVRGRTDEAPDDAWVIERVIERR
jgi:hypothetical protein